MQKSLKPLKNYLPELLSLIILPIYFFYVAFHRLIARDEGFYNIASKLVMEGRAVYQDFFYPQMPLLPSIYALWFKFFGATWESSRIFTAILAIFLGLLLVHLVKTKFGATLAILSLFLYATNNYVLAYLTVTKTYTLSIFFLFLSFYLLILKPDKIWSTLFAGVAFSLSIQVRLFFAGLLPIFLIYFLLNKNSLNIKLKNILYFCIGGFVVSVPSLVLALKDFDLFYFNNLGYHLNRAEMSLDEVVENKTKILTTIAGLRQGVAFDAFHFPILNLLVFISFIYFLLKKKIIFLDFLIFSGLFLLNILPSPTYIQYFVTLVPFAIFSLARLLNQFKNFKLQIILIFIIVLSYGYNFKSEVIKYTKSGVGVIGIMNQKEAKEWSLENIIEINNFIDLKIPNNEQIFTFWPGYLLHSSAYPLSKAENHYAFHAAKNLPVELQEKYKIISDKEIRNLIKEQKIKYLFLTQNSIEKRNLKNLLNNSNYCPAYNLNKNYIYQGCSLND